MTKRINYTPDDADDDRPRAAPSQPTPTSVAAADAIEEHIARLEYAVAYELWRRGDDGATDQELALALRLPDNTARPRRIALMHRGAVIDSGRTRKTLAGRDATVWLWAGDQPKVEDLPGAMTLSLVLRVTTLHPQDVAKTVEQLVKRTKKHGGRLGLSIEVKTYSLVAEEEDPSLT